VTIEDGNNPTGGGIANSGTFDLKNSVVSGSGASNETPGDNGAGIWNGGTLTVTNSTFSENSGWDGGGISNSGTLKVTDSTFSDNTAGDGGGGIFNFRAAASVTDSTFSGNSTRSGAVGGGIYNDGGTMDLISSTLSGNSATLAGGIYNDATLTATATIVANSSSGGDCSGYINEESPAHITDAGFNLDDDDSCGFSASNLSLSGVNPDLGPLQYNGGRTETMALLPGSPAIGAVNSAPLCLIRDQRDVKRHTPCDIGAYQTPKTHRGR
jgi:hypothetical protein